MKRISLFCIGVTVFFFGMPVMADTTYVIGTISNDTVWNTAGSPYIVTGNLLIDSSATLDVEPGVAIFINSLKNITVKGVLSAVGTSTDSIIITKYQGSWGRLRIKPSARCSLKYCRIEYAESSAIYNESDDSIYVGYSNIENNFTWCIIGGGIYNSGTITITNNRIYKNYAGLGAAGIWNNNYAIAIIKNNIISDNTVGMDGSETGIINLGTAIITDNIICNNGSTFETGGGIGNWSGGTATIMNNTIYNNPVGVWNDGFAEIINNNIYDNCGNGAGGIRNHGPAIITGNNISNNWGGGLCNTYDSVIITNNAISYNECSMWAYGNNIDNSGSNVIIKYNTIIDTGFGYYANDTLPSIYNSGAGVVICSTNIYAKYCSVYNDSTDSLIARYNYWGTTDTGIIDTRIWDFYDNSSKGIVIYKPFLDDSFKVGVKEQSIVNRQQLTVTTKPNPFIQSTVISYQLPVGGKVSLVLYDIAGSCVKMLVNEEKQVGSYSVCVDAKELKAGIYFIKLKTGNYQETKKVVLMR
ncbi:MAG: T9SS type A sorting domain-containing protein [bacterium]|nr:T9SS type A sorting domain-containing protein [bacterium]